MSESSYLMIETQSPDDGPGSTAFIGSAVDLACAGRKVSLWLLQNGVLTLLSPEYGWCDWIAETAGNLCVRVDAFSLAQRSIEHDLVEAAGAETGDMPELVAQMMMPNCKVIWH